MFIWWTESTVRLPDRRGKTDSMWKPFPVKRTVRVKRSEKTRESPMKRSLVLSNVSKKSSE